MATIEDVKQFLAKNASSDPRNTLHQLKAMVFGQVVKETTPATDEPAEETEAPEETTDDPQAPTRRKRMRSR